MSLFGFLRRHYNGDYSLARSYWVNTLLLSLFAPLLGLLLLPWLTSNFPARYGSMAFLMVTALGLALWVWAVVGTWASANKHVGRGGKQGWATLVKVLIVLGGLRTVGDVVSLAPALREHVEVAAGAQVGPATELEVRADGRSILLSGGINDGSAQQLDRALDAAPSVTTVVLSSQGGWLREGEMLAEVIRRRGLNTYVEGVCASACTIAFLAGRDRAASPQAKIGFHSSRGVGAPDAKASPFKPTDDLERIYRAAGLPTSFITKALSTPHAEMWAPSHDELMQAGVLTRRSDGGETASMATRLRSREQLVAEFRQAPLFSALAQRSPEDFDRMTTAAWNKIVAGAPDAEVLLAGRQHLMVAFARYLPQGRDDTLVAYQLLMQEQLQALRERSVDACVEMAFPTGRSMNVIANLPPELRNRELVLMEQVIRESDPSRLAGLDRGEGMKVVQQAAAALSPQQRAVFTDANARNAASPALVCDTAIGFFAGLNAIPVAERGRALRALYASE